jgi:predicted hydrocarbon binding protein
MPHSLDLANHEMLAITRSSLAALRAALIRDAGPSAATYLQEAGYAGGQALFDSFRSWVAARTEVELEELDVETFERFATEYFRDAGWGSLHLGTLNDAVATLDSEDWGEADPNSGLDYPACHLTTGMFADFFGRIADTSLAVLEVECRSMGSPRCRFLVGNAEVMEHIYEEMGRGVGYAEAAEAVH